MNHENEHGGTPTTHRRLGGRETGSLSRGTKARWRNREGASRIYINHSRRSSSREPPRGFLANDHETRAKLAGWRLRRGKIARFSVLCPLLRGRDEEIRCNATNRFPPSVLRTSKRAWRGTSKRRTLIESFTCRNGSLFLDEQIRSLKRVIAC